jgi:phosphoribosyl 1,2-cyclic phosphate phosphodiesterase
MRLHLLGTGGADGVPALYSDTRVSRYAREHGGKDVRSRAAALIDGHIKIDFGPDTWAQVVREGLDARDWTSVIFTHADADHLAVEELQYSLYPFNSYEAAGFVIYGNNRIVETVGRRYPDWPFEVVLTESFVPFDCCDYRVTPIRAKHGAEGEDAQNLIIERDGRSLLYATDTGIWEEPTWEFLQDYRLDLLVLECTEGFVLTPYNGHLDIEEFRQVVARLRDIGTVTDSTKIVTTHHSHNGEATHTELEAALGPEGVVVGYDGLVIEA